ncbi:uncharacterized protein TNCV_2946291 [Trichonephila clavipes]|nr:uncharacterized protein TNCV_2946291 [Trichonephila clavipes]
MRKRRKWYTHDFLEESQRLLKNAPTSKDAGLTPATERMWNISKYPRHLLDFACYDGNPRNQDLVGVDGACVNQTLHMALHIWRKKSSSKDISVNYDAVSQLKDYAGKNCRTDFKEVIMKTPLKISKASDSMDKQASSIANGDRQSFDHYDFQSEFRRYFEINNKQ